MLKIYFQLLSTPHHTEGLQGNVSVIQISHACSSHDQVYSTGWMSTVSSPHIFPLDEMLVHQQVACHLKIM